MATLPKQPSNKMTPQNYATPAEVQNMPTLPSRLRAFVFDRATGKPIAKVVVAAIAELEKVQNPGEKREVTIGLLASDHAGYVSFDLSGLPPLDNDNNPRPEKTNNVWLVPLHAPDNRVEVLSKMVDLSDPIMTMLIDQLSATAKSGNPNLPSIQGCADAMDWKVSPYSVSTEDMLIVGEPGCEALLLSKAVERTFRFAQLVRKPDSDLEVLNSTAPDLPSVSHRLGALLEYEMTWQPVGHGLGQVLYSLPLAPCESVKLAIIDWARDDRSIRGEVTGVNENLLHNQYRYRQIDEAVDATLHEWQRGGSLMGGTAGAGGFGNSMWGISGTHAIGGGYSTSSGTRNVAADTVQNLEDKIFQASSLMRRLNSTVITQASQWERERIETRTVTNHNHGHSLTVLYYEVVRHYCVTTRLAKKQDVILVQYRDQFINEFDEAITLQYRLILERALLDERLRGCFDALAKLQSDRFALRTTDSPADYKFATFRATISTSNGTDSDPYIKLIKVDGSEIWCLQIDPSDTGDQHYLGFVDYNDFEAGDVDEYSLRPEGDQEVRWGDISRVKIGLANLRGENPHWGLAHLKLEGLMRNGTVLLFDEDINETLSNSTVTRDLLQPPPVPSVLSTEELYCVYQLLTHLNANKSYYNRAIWLAEDPDERARRFDMYQFAIGRESGRLIDFIENRPVGVSGDYVAFPLGNDNSFADSIMDAAIERIISLPTRGAFAEAKLSHCNACEKRDPTRFWKWQEAPCPETPPDITGITPGSRARDIIGTPTTLPAAGIEIETPPEAPAPTGMDKVLELLGQPEIFRNMSVSAEVGTLLGQLVAGAVDLEKSRMANQTELQQSLIAAKTGQRTGGGAGADATMGGSGGGTGTGGGVGGGGNGRVPGEQGPSENHTLRRNKDAAEVYDMNRVIEDSVNQGIITPEQGNRATLRNIQYGLDPLDPDIPHFRGSDDESFWVAQFRLRWTEFRRRLLDVANNESQRWLRPDGTHIEENEPDGQTVIRQYWEGLGLHYPGFATAWSAVFISWLMGTAGAGEYFLYSPRHIDYIRAARRNRDNMIRENPFWLYCPNEVVLEQGDLVCKNRDASNYTCNNLAGGPGLTHCDLVVEVLGGQVEVIGGNKDNPDTPSHQGTTVARQILRTDADGHIATDGDQNDIFAVIKLRTEYDDRPGSNWI